MNLIKLFIIFLILTLIGIQVYFYYFDKNTDENFNDENIEEIKDIENIEEIENIKNTENILNINKQMVDTIIEETNENEINVDKYMIEDEKNEYFNFNDNYDNQQIINFENPNPWNKIIINDINKKFFLKIYNYNEEKFIKWKTLIKNLDYDINTKELIIQEPENVSLAITHLILSNFNNEINFEEIINHNLIDISIEKTNIKNVTKRLKSLIKKSIHPDTSNINQVNTEVLNEKPLNLFNTNNISPYGGTEYAFF
tara:strand:- start:453 stop:1220 length:768 start_codon:yes stop_codon:yes gene_type:complete